MRWLLLAVLVGCGGAQPDRPVLAGVPRPDQGVLAGGVAAAAAAITLADPDGAGTAEKPDDPIDKKPIKVKENVPSAVLDRLDAPAPAADPKNPATSTDTPASKTAAKNRAPTKDRAAKGKSPSKTGAKANLKLPTDALDFSDD